MVWSGGNYTKGNNATGGWTGDASLGIGIEAGRHDTQDNDFATGINQCLNKDGSNAATGNLNLGSNKLTNVAVGTASTDAVNLGQVQAGIDQARTTQNYILGKFSADSGGINQIFQKSRGATVGTNTVVQTSDSLGAIVWQGANGTSYNSAAVIACEVDQTPGLNDMPGRLTFSTTPDGTSTAVERMRIDNAGNVGVGTAAADRLHVLSSSEDNTLRLETSVNRPTLRFVRSGTSRATMFTDGGAFVTGSADALTCRAGASGGVYLAQTGTSWTAISDERFKKNVENLNYGLTEVLSLRPIRFDYIDDETDGSSRLGFIAQEVKPLLPEVVIGDETIKLGVNITDLIPTLVKAIQQLNAKVEALEARTAALEV